MTGESPDIASLVAAARFGHGYLLQLGGAVPAAVSDWPLLRVGDADLRTHPRTVVTAVRGRRREDLQVVLLGQPLDVDLGTHDPVRIARVVLGALRRGEDAAVQRVAAVSGRYTAVLRRGRRLWVVPDSHATQPVLWAARPQAGTPRTAFAVASHTVLAAEVVGSGLDEAALGLLARLREVKPQGTIFMPGLTTTHEGVLPVFPNCLLDVDLDAPQRATHRRFWPVEPRTKRPTAEVLPEFVDRFTTIVRLSLELGRVGISLTSGLDSRTTLVAAAAMARPDDFAFTYVRPEDLVARKDVREDLYGASALAFTAGLRHRVLEWRLPGPEDPFRIAHEQSFPALPASLGAATAMFHDLPPDVVELASLLTETGTWFYPPDRRGAAFSPRALTAVTFGAPAAAREEFVEELERLVDYTDFRIDRLGGYSWYDMTYWEHRVAKWAGRKVQEGDMSHRVALPFADRRLIALMHSLPPQDRFAKALLHGFIARRPDLASADPALGLRG